MNLTQQRWRLLTVSCVINLFAGSIYAWSVFGSALAARLTDLTGAAVTGADLALAFGLANGLGPVPMIFGGAVNDRFGPRFVIVAGGILMGLGLFLTGSAESATGVILSYGLFFGLGLGLVYGCTINNTMKFFPDRRGLVGGLTTAAYGISSVLVPPVASYLITEAGVSSALQIFGVLFGVVIVTGGLLSMRCPPGFSPEGWTPPAGRAATGAERNWRAMLASSEFLPMILLLMCGAIAAMMVIAHVFSIARDQMAWSAVEASAAVSIIALANTFGRIFAGTLSDRLGRLPALSLGLVLSLSGLAALALSGPESRALFYVGLAAVGISFGSFMGVFPGYTAEVFGSRNNSVNFGIMFAGFSVAGIAGPALMGTLRAAGLGYPVCYLAGGLISAAGFLCILRLFGLRRRLAAAEAAS